MPLDRQQAALLEMKVSYKSKLVLVSWDKLIKLKILSTPVATDVAYPF